MPELSCMSSTSIISLSSQDSGSKDIREGRTSDCECKSTVEKVISPPKKKKIWVLLGGEKCLWGSCKMWAALNCWVQAKQRHQCLIQDEKEEISKVILSWINSMGRWFIQVINTVGSWLLSSRTDRMWFDSKSQLGTFSGNLSLPQMKHLKNSLHTYWLWCYSEGREDNRETCFFKCSLGHKG